MPTIPKHLLNSIDNNLRLADKILAEMDKMIADQQKLIDFCNLDDPMVSTGLPERRGMDITLDAISDFVENC